MCHLMSNNTVTYIYRIVAPTFPGLTSIHSSTQESGKLQKAGLLPGAALRDCLCHSFLCGKCGMCGDTSKREMRLTLIQEASANLPTSVE